MLKFSLLHTTVRLDGWKQAYLDWFNRSDYPNEIEYILCTETPVGYGTNFDDLPFADRSRWVSVNGAGSCVAGWNCAAEHAVGDVLITVSDDFAPCRHWDTELLKVIPDLGGQYVVAVAAGRTDNLMTISILTRAYYKRYGRIFYYGYDSRGAMYTDNDFTDVAYRDGVVVDARHLVFEHRHPSYGLVPWDSVYTRCNRPEAYQHGEAVYRWRKAHDFADAPLWFDYKGVY